MEIFGIHKVKKVDKVSTAESVSAAATDVAKAVVTDTPEAVVSVTAPKPAATDSVARAAGITRLVEEQRKRKQRIAAIAVGGIKPSPKERREET